MQVDLNTANTGFGALYVHRGAGKYSSAYKFNNDVVEFVSQRLKTMAEESNVDIHVKCRNLWKKGFDIYVGKVEKSPIKRLLSYLVEDKTRINEYEVYETENVPDLLLNTIEEAKNYFVKFREYLTQ